MVPCLCTPHFWFFLLEVNNMNDKVLEVKREIARNKVKMKDKNLTEKEKEELVREENYLRQKLYYERLNEIFERMANRKDEKHKRR